MKVAIAGGGTGGHVYPGIAVAEEVTRRGGEVFFIGTRSGLESRIVPKAGYRIEFVRASPIKRGRPIQNVASLFSNTRGLFDARTVLRRERPDIVLGTGGFVSFTACLAARMLGIPLVIHEQNAVPGLANRALSRLADRVLTSWGEDAVGLPVRSEFGQAGDKGGGIIVFGGSRGAASINAAMEKIAPRISGKKILWATGTDHFEKYKSTPGAHVVPYIDDMPKVLAAADFAITRAGAMTLAELAAAGTPAILVPYPYATADHQTANARAFVAAGAAELVPDAELSERLYDSVTTLLRAPEKLKFMSAAARSLAHPYAAHDIVNILEKAVR